MNIVVKEIALKYGLAELKTPRKENKIKTTVIDQNHFINWDEFNTEGLLYVRTKYNPLYVLWTQIKVRCQSNAETDAKRYYKDKGVQFYQPWQDSFLTFSHYIIDTLGKKPMAGWSIDRIDTNGNYEPGNIRWASPLTQGRNRRNNILNMENTILISTLRKYFKVTYKKLIEIIRNEKLANRDNFTQVAIQTMCRTYNHLV